MIYQRFAIAILLVLSALTGTNAEEKEREGGLTGTGIVGEISHLGSIVVNGQHITFASDMKVGNPLGPKPAHALVPGNVVAVAVTPDDQDWQAVAINEVYPLVGPVTASDETTFKVLGVDVQWHDNRPGIGDWVAVSGFWARDIVVATHVQRIASQQTGSIQGSYRMSPDSASFTVGSVVLNISPLQHAAEGDVVRISGPVTNNALAVTDVHLGLFDVPVSLVLAEGYLTDVAPSGHYTVAGTGLSSYTDNLQSSMPEDRISVCGTNGRLDQIEDDAYTTLARRLGCFNPPN